MKSAELDGPGEPDTAFRWKAGSSSLTSTLQVVDPPHEIAWTGRTMGIKAIHVFPVEASDDGTLVARRSPPQGRVRAPRCPGVSAPRGHVLTDWPTSIRVRLRSSSSCSAPRRSDPERALPPFGPRRRLTTVLRVFERESGRRCCARPLAPPRRGRMRRAWRRCCEGASRRSSRSGTARPRPLCWSCGR